LCVRKTATNSVAIQGQDFTFDAVADEVSTQVSEIGVNLGVISVLMCL
jgi:kinesin family protein 15